jgi:hypothetical protein
VRRSAPAQGTSSVLPPSSVSVGPRLDASARPAPYAACGCPYCQYRLGSLARASTSTFSVRDFMGSPTRDRPGYRPSWVYGAITIMTPFVAA